VLSEGDRVPADATLLTGSQVAVDESLLTGESAAVRKQAWEASGIGMQSQEAWGVGNEDRVIMMFQVLGADQKEAALFLFTTVGDRYLSLSGAVI
jgi:magnesium-transporting ATPase (P-type)